MIWCCLFPHRPHIGLYCSHRAGPAATPRHPSCLAQVGWAGRLRFESGSYRSASPPQDRLQWRQTRSEIRLIGIELTSYWLLSTSPNHRGAVKCSLMVYCGFPSKRHYHNERENLMAHDVIRINKPAEKTLLVICLL